MTLQEKIAREELIDRAAHIIHERVYPEEPWEDCPGMWADHRSLAAALFALLPDARVPEGWVKDWRKVQRMAGAGLGQVAESHPAWETFADIHAFAVRQQTGPAQEPINEAAPPPPKGESR